MSIFSIQFVTLKYHFSLKSKQLCGEISGSRFGQEMFKMNLDHLVMLDGKEATKEYWGHVRRTQEPSWRGSHWPEMQHFELE